MVKPPHVLPMYPLGDGPQLLPSSRSLCPTLSLIDCNAQLELPRSLLELVTLRALLGFFLIQPPHALQVLPAGLSFSVHCSSHAVLHN
jgi:hypothetical protein